MAKMKVLGASKGSRVQSYLSKVSDGMEPYFEKGQQEKKTPNIKADPFIPQVQPMHTHGHICQSKVLPILKYQ